MFFSPFKQYQKQLSALYKRKHDLESENEEAAKPGSELYELMNEIDQFIEGEYSEAVFSYYVEKKPTLIRVQTGEEVTWEAAFGTKYDDVLKSLKHSLVGLVEGGGRYKVK